MAARVASGRARRFGLCPTGAAADAPELRQASASANTPKFRAGSRYSRVGAPTYKAAAEVKGGALLERHLIFPEWTPN